MHCFANYNWPVWAQTASVFSWVVLTKRLEADSVISQGPSQGHEVNRHSLSPDAALQLGVHLVDRATAETMGGMPKKDDQDVAVINDRKGDGSDAMA